MFICFSPSVCCMWIGGFICSWFCYFYDEKNTIVVTREKKRRKQNITTTANKNPLKKHKRTHFNAKQEKNGIKSMK